MKKVIFVILALGFCLPVLAAIDYQCSYSADTNADCKISSAELDVYRQYHQKGWVTLTQLLRTIQFYQAAGYVRPLPGRVTEDGFTPAWAEATYLGSSIVKNRPNTPYQYLSAIIRFKIKSYYTNIILPPTVVAHWTDGTNNLPAQVNVSVTGAKELAKGKISSVKVTSRLMPSAISQDGSYWLVIDQIYYTVDDQPISVYHSEQLRSGGFKTGAIMFTKSPISEADNTSQLASLISSLEAILAQLKSLAQ